MASAETLFGLNEWTPPRFDEKREEKSEVG